MIRLRTTIIAASALIGTIALALPFMPTNASDHIDSPSIAQDRGSDIADNWAFLDPNDNSMVVLVMSTQDFIVSGEHFGMPIFDHNIRYRFEIENTGDARPDQFVDVTYSRGLGRQMPQTATIRLPNGQSFTAPTTISTQEYRPPTPVVTTNRETGVSFFGGNADDPFFLDDTGANRMVASSIMNPGRPNKSLLSERGGRDTYAGFNTLITAVRVPVAMLRGKAGNVIGINAVTQRRQTQQINANGVVEGSGNWVTIDRDGGPLVNNGLIPAPRKDEYNAASTEDDAKGRFQADIVKSLKNMGTDDAHIAMLAKAAVEKGDILRLDLTVPNTGTGGGNNANGGFANMGGRRLQDDVVDITFTLINNGVPLGDKVDRNEVAFRDQFPFVADPAQPFPPGSGTDDRTRQ
ncbi:MAG: DUF4331 domain-containing protein [Stenomitos rutilans HA7619-LM2]|jgi:hypothetical protein|nr:DUF4331 domain-containing protein [Stenomitos rutilans HA7619-LM2]